MDHPRFDRIQGNRENLHLAYHGGAAVDLVLRLVDRWLIKRSAAPTINGASPDGVGKSTGLITSQQTE